MGMNGNRRFDLGGERTIQHTDVFQNCPPETWIILLTNATTINSMQIKKKGGKKMGL